MKIKSTTWVLLIIAIFLGIGVYIYELQINPKQEEIETQKKQLFTFDEKDIRKLTIETKEITYVFEKTKDENKPWQMRQPQDKVANDAVVSFLTNLLVGSESERNFTVPKTQKEEYGLDQPLGTITVELENKKQYKIIIGNTDFQGELLYAQINPMDSSQEEIKVYLIPKNFQYAIDRQPEEWVEEN